MLDKPKRDPALIKKIKNWAYENLLITKEATVSVMELQCHEKDCPPLETVIAVMEQGLETRQCKFHKPITEVTQKDFECVKLHSTSRA